MVEKIPEGLIVSCQALKHEPLYGKNIMSKMALAAKNGGAIAIRANTVKDINAISKCLNNELPIIGLIKENYPDSSIYISPTLKEIKQLIKSKCHVIALDATFRKRPNNETLTDLVAYIRKNSDKKIMADISTVEEAIFADELGVDYVSSTLCGYTEATAHMQIPNVEFLKEIKNSVKNAVVVAEGGIHSYEKLKDILNLGYKHVVIGGAITRPQQITQQYRAVFDNHN